MNVIVCGGRDYDDKAAVFSALDEFVPPGSVVIHGAATGADTLAGEWANDRGFECVAVPAQWSEHGKAAGPIRNLKMLHDHGLVSLVVAFPGGRGTAHMVQAARDAGVDVLRVD